MDALPLASAVAVEVKPPPLSVTVPVAAGFPLTAIVTLNDCVVEMLLEAGVTVTVGVVLEVVVVVPPPPPPHPAVHRLPATQSQNAACRLKPLIHALPGRRRDRSPGRGAQQNARIPAPLSLPPSCPLTVRKPSYHAAIWYRNHFLAQRSRASPAGYPCSGYLQHVTAVFPLFARYPSRIAHAVPHSHGAGELRDRYHKRLPAKQRKITAFGT